MNTLEMELMLAELEKRLPHVAKLPALTILTCMRQLTKRTSTYVDLATFVELERNLYVTLKAQRYDAHPSVRRAASHCPIRNSSGIDARIDEQ